MKRSTFAALLTVSLMVSVVSFVPAEAGMHVSFKYTTQPADIQVWLEAGDVYYEDARYGGYDVYPAVENVVLSVRASRSCYATVYVVDTAGYIHVVYPMSPYDNTYLRGGTVYRFYLADFDFGGAFDRGVAYAFAVSSPVRFSYRYYGWGVFAGHFGWQIYGDPYVAARSFYVGLVPASCDYRVIGVSHARFYVREYVRYPSYLCAGWHDYHGTGRYCRAGCEVYRQYSVHAKDPYRALRPAGGRGKPADGYTEIKRTERWRGESRVNTVKGESRGRPVAYESSVARPIGKRTNSGHSVVKSSRVISSKNSFVQSKVQSKKDLSAMRRELARRAPNERARRDAGAALRDVPKRDAKAKNVTKRTQQIARAKEVSKSSAKRASKETSRDKSRSRAADRREAR
jgi:hypothetical protein